MTVVRKMITASAALAFCAAQGATLAREMPIPGAPGGPDKSKPRGVASCVKEVDRSAVSLGTDNPGSQYTSVTIKVKNSCGQSHDATLDVANMPDPKCQKVGPGKTAEFIYQYNMNYQPPPRQYRRIKECRA